MAQVALATLEPVASGAVDIHYSRLVLNRRTGEKSVTVTLTRAGDNALPPGELYIAFEEIGPAPITLGNPDALSQEGIPYFLRDTALLNAGQSLQIILRIPGAGRRRVNYAPTLYVPPPPDELTAAIVANPESGTSPLTVRFSPDIQNNNIVINSYQWDFNGDGRVDVSDSFGAPKTYTYTGQPGTTFEARLTATPANGEPLVATKTITIDNRPPTAQVSADATNGHTPLPITFTVQAQDPQGIDQIRIDYQGDGIYDATQTGNGASSGTWTFDTNYQTEGTFVAQVSVTDTFGAETIVTNAAITVDVNNPRDPVISLTASPNVGTLPLTTNLTATATLYDGSAIASWEWDSDGDGQFETTGGNAETDILRTTYDQLDDFYPVVKVTTDSGRSAIASTHIQTQSNAQPTLSIPNASDTINTDASETANIDITLPYATEAAVWMEDADGTRVKTLVPRQTQAAGSYTFVWDGSDQQNLPLSEGDYYAVLGYNAYGTDKELDLRTTTGGQLSYYRRTTANPRTFNRLEAPLRIDYAVDDPAEVSFFWQISFGSRLMTLMEHERLGRGQYSLYWNGEYPSGQKIPQNLQQLMPGIVRYSLPSNVIFVQQNPRIEDYRLASTLIADPRREPIGLEITLSKDSAIELVVSDMEKGVDVARRFYVDLTAGPHTLTWDGKNDDDQYLAPGDYRLGVRSIDDVGKRSLFWYRTQRIDY